jgi:hypothetical protein
MSDDYFSALADNAAKTVKETQKVSNQIVSKSSGILPKVFTFAFIVLLLYMGFNFARISPSTKKNEIAVGGIFYGNVEADKNGNVNIPLGDKNNLSKGKIDVSNSTPEEKDPEPSPEPNPDPSPDNPYPISPEPKPDVTIKITDRLKVGMSYFDVLALLGAPTKKLQLVNDSKLASGFTVFVWDVDKRLMVTFYKNKLHSVSYQ